MLILARRLIALETRGSKPPSSKNPVLFPVFDKLRPHLVMLVGRAGYHALVSRALALAETESSWLRGVKVKADGSLPLWGEVPVEPEINEFLDGRVDLLAHLIGLMAAFIGEKLTVRLVGEVWPKASLIDFNFGNGVKNEKTK